MGQQVEGLVQRVGIVGRHVHGGGVSVAGDTVMISRVVSASSTRADSPAPVLSHAIWTMTREARIRGLDSGLWDGSEARVIPGFWTKSCCGTAALAGVGGQG